MDLDPAAELMDIRRFLALSFQISHSQDPILLNLKEFTKLFQDKQLLQQHIQKPSFCQTTPVNEEFLVLSDFITVFLNTFQLLKQFASINQEPQPFPPLHFLRVLIAQRAIANDQTNQLFPSSVLNYSNNHNFENYSLGRMYQLLQFMKLIQSDNTSSTGPKPSNEIELARQIANNLWNKYASFEQLMKAQTTPDSNVYQCINSATVGSSHNGFATHING